MRACKLTTKFQTTIPKEIRQKLNLKAGDRVHFEIHEAGFVHVKKAQVMETSAVIEDPEPEVAVTNESSLGHDDCL